MLYYLDIKSDILLEQVNNYLVRRNLMKKHIFLCSIMSAIVLTCLTVSVTAADKGISELPHVKIIIDGQSGTYKNVPISVDDKTLLPLREVLTNLGVENDDEHIIWDGKENSVTVVKDSDKIYLKVGSDKATVNGKEVALDTEAVLYKDRTYIPVGFVAQSLGKKVVWDGSSKSVLIRDEAEFNRIQDIIKKSDAAMAEINNYQVKLDLTATSRQEDFSLDIGTTVDSKVDMLNKDMYLNMKMNMLGTDLNMEAYFVDNVLYARYAGEEMSEEWIKTEMPGEEYEELFKQNGNTDIFDASDALSAGLKEVQSENAGEILLKGDVFLGELLKMVGQEQGQDFSGMEFDKFNIEISLDKDTYRINRLVMEMTYLPAPYADVEPGKVEMHVSCEYSDYNSSVKITVPQEVLEKAVDAYDFDLENYDDEI